MIAHRHQRHPQRAAHMAQAEPLAQPQTQKIADLAHSNMGPRQRQPPRTSWSTNRGRLSLPLSSRQRHAPPALAKLGVYENSGIGVRKRSESVYGNLRNPQSAIGAAQKGTAPG